MQGIRRKRRASSGQTLLLGIISLVVILAAILIFFDVQNIIRGKVKGQNAVDAAALAGANWQMHSLNLIGELNLVKATSILISDESLGISMQPEDFTLVKSESELDTKQKIIREIQRVEKEKNMMRTALALLDEMQTRISFIGPLIGFGAAQQAAKNNGINANFDAGKLLKDTFYSFVWDDSVYGNPLAASQIINGYRWLTPYRNMLASILDIDGDDMVYGIAAGTRFHFLGAPEINSNGNLIYQYLTQRSFYDAVNGDNWCELVEFLDYARDNEKNGEIVVLRPEEIVNMYGDFIEQSEILPIHITFKKNRREVLANNYIGKNQQPGTFSSVLNLILQRRTASGMRDSALIFDTQDPYVHKYKVNEETGAIELLLDKDGGTWWRNPNDTDSRFSLPPMQWALFDDEHWSRYEDEMIPQWERYFASAFKEGMEYKSGALSYFEIVQTMPTFAGSKRVGSAFRDVGGSDALGRRMKTYGNSAANTSASLATLSTPLTATASAKPIGRLKVSASGSAGAGTSLPPFCAGRLVLPVFTNTALIPVALEPPPGISMLDVAWFYYVTEFLPIFMERGEWELSQAWEEASSRYPDHLAYFAPFYEALKKVASKQWRDAGLEWLDTPIEWRTGRDGSVEVIRRNRDTCNYWPSGGGGGTRHGPGILH